jgi:hypothetical protein
MKDVNDLGVKYSRYFFKSFKNDLLQGQIDESKEIIFSNDSNNIPRASVLLCNIMSLKIDQSSYCK